MKIKAYLTYMLLFALALLGLAWPVAVAAAVEMVLPVWPGMTVAALPVAVAGHWQSIWNWSTLSRELQQRWCPRPRQVS